MELPRPPDDPEMKNIIDKLAQFVARNGPAFEAMTKSKQENNPKFAFLFGGQYFNYYTYKVTTEQQLQRHKAAKEATNAGPRPLMEIDVGGAFYGGQPHGYGGQPWAPPEPPLTTPLKEQLAILQAQQATLHTQIRQSEQNLSAQWTVLQQNQEILIAEAIAKAQDEQLEQLSRANSISLSIFQSVLQPIIDSCTKDSISSGKSWIFQNASSPAAIKLITEYLNFRVSSESSDFTAKLHLIYLVNDVLHHCVRKNNQELKIAFEAVTVPMYTAAACSADPDQMQKLTKLLTLWETKSKFFDDAVLEKLKKFEESYGEYKAGLKAEFRSAVESVEETTRQTYEGYKAQHDQFVEHATGQIGHHQAEAERLQQQIAGMETAYEETYRSWQQQTGGGVGGAAANRRSRWDKAAPAGGMMPGLHMPGMPPGVPLADLSRPPPGFITPMQETIPTLPYFDLPAGLMVPLVHLEDSGYKPLDPERIRLPPPQPPNERLLAAVEMFYSPPSHERPRDPEGWERLGLYEWARDKHYAMKRKEEDIKSGKRQRSPTASPSHSNSRESTPDQTVPSTGGRESRNKKRYRSRSASRSRTRSRSRSRTRSRSRGSTPPRGSTSKQGAKSRKRSRTRSRTRSRSRSRDQTRSRTRSRSRSRSRSRQRSRSRGRSRTRSRSRSRDRYALPRHLTNRSPSPAVASAFTGDRRLPESNKGHQLLQKMGWKGSGLGSQETGRLEPVSGGEVRDRSEQYRGMGVVPAGSDPFQSFRKQRAGVFYTRMTGNEAKEAEEEDG